MGDLESFIKNAEMYVEKKYGVTGDMQQFVTMSLALKEARVIVRNIVEDDEKNMNELVDVLLTTALANNKKCVAQDAVKGFGEAKIANKISYDKLVKELNKYV